MNARYQVYLQSDAWAQKREVVRARALGRCEFCGARMEHVHHVRYPKHLGDESLDDLVAVCKSCHDKSHGVRKMNLLPVPEPKVIRVRPPGGYPFEVCTSINGNAYATPRAWIEALKIPTFRWEHVKSMINNEILDPRNTGELPEAEFNGARLISWPIIAAALRGEDRQHYNIKNTWHPVKSEFSQTQFREMVEFMERIDSLDRWGWRLQSKALAGRIDGSGVIESAQPIPQNVAQMLAILGKESMYHDARLARVEAITQRSTKGIITVVEGCLETALDHASRVPGRGRLNLACAAGVDLSAQGCKSFGRTGRRDDGCPQTIEVNRWYRKDVYRVLGELTGRDFSALLVDDEERLETRPPTTDLFQ